MMAVMASTLGKSGSTVVRPPELSVPPATRARSAGWRDPRLWVGLAIVALSVVAGARLLGAADDSVQVWSVAEPLAAGEQVGAEDLLATRVRFAEASDLDRYLLVEDPLPADAALVRAVEAGELLPRSALGEAAAEGVVRVPLTLPGTAVLPDLRPGQRVDVYVAAQDAARPRPAELVLEDAEVVSVSAAADGLGASAERQLVLGVDPEQRADLPDALGRVASGTVTVVGRG